MPSIMVLSCRRQFTGARRRVALKVGKFHLGGHHEVSLGFGVGLHCSRREYYGLGNPLAGSIWRQRDTTMPVGPQGQKRPANVTVCAVHVMKIATDEIEELPPATKHPARALGGKAGGKARADSLSATRRSEISKKAASTRWKEK